MSRTMDVRGGSEGGSGQARGFFLAPNVLIAPFKVPSTSFLNEDKF